MFIRYQSRLELFGVPLLSVALGPDLSSHQARLVARGLIAVGDIAVGGFAIGGVAIGIVSLGGMAFGALPIGRLALGIVALGGVAMGGVALGGLAIGVKGWVVSPWGFMHTAVWPSGCIAKVAPSFDCSEGSCIRRDTA